MDFSEADVLRFNAKIRKTDGCWEWSSGKTGSGYGAFWLKTRNIGAHVFSYEMNVGRIPEGKFVCHRCDNPGCVNPAHLFTGTSKDNHDDMVIKNRRGKCGSKPGSMTGHMNPRAIYTENQVREIRNLYKGRGKGPSCKNLADIYGGDRTSIHQIIKRKSWKHI